MTVLVGRRVATVDAIERPGDYCGPIIGYTGSLPAVIYLLPNAQPGDFTHHVTSPPHVFRECADGSLEVRQSILAKFHGQEVWHGFLDEGHRWRT